jgi:hypothetical protein
LKLEQGTTLVVLSTDDGVVMAADNLAYSDTASGPQSAHDPVQKVFACGERLIVGSAAALVFSFRGVPIRGMDGTLHTLSFEYKFQDWIEQFVSMESSVSYKDAYSLGSAIHDKARQTFQPVDIMLKAGYRADEKPRERFVTFVVGGYSQDFQHFALFEIGIEVNADGNGLVYSPLRDCEKNFFCVGETELLQKALARQRPFDEMGAKFSRSSLKAVREVLPNVGASLHEMVTFCVGLIRLEAYYNPKKVGRSVTVCLIEKSSRLSAVVTIGSGS